MPNHQIDSQLPSCISRLWKQFSESQLLTLKSLRSCLSNFSGVVAIDIEGQDDRISEIGLAFLSSKVLSATENTIFSSLQDFASTRHFQAYNIQVQGKRTKQNQQQREIFAYGKTSHTDSDTLQSHIATIFEKYQKEGNLLLIVYATTSEFQWLSKKGIEIIPYFSAWLDIQPHVIYTTGSSPSLTQCIKSLGIADSRSRTKNSRSRLHCAGNDVIRTLALFNILIILPETATRLEITPIEQRPKRSSETWRNWWRKPDLKSYPFTAKISTTDSQLPVELLTPLGLWTYFKDYVPIKVWKEATTERSNIRLKRSWISFSSHEQLSKFINEINGKCIAGKKIDVLWEWPQGYSPVEAESVKEFHIRSKAAIAEQKRAWRANLVENEDARELPNWF
jgi:hypothetical protein